MTVKYWKAVNTALHDSFEEHPLAVLWGEDVGAPGGAFGASKGMLDAFGPGRVRDTPISELALAGFGVGAGLVGLRPVVEIMFSDFLPLASDQLINQAAKMRYMSGGAASVPLVVRSIVGSGSNTGPQHGQSLEAVFTHIPGLQVVSPATPNDAYWMLRQAVRCDDPVLVLESLPLWGMRGELDTGTEQPLSGAAVRREGDDLTVVTYGGRLPTVMAAAESLGDEGVGVEVIDLRSLLPLDTDTIAASVRRTGRLLVVHAAVRFGGFGGEIAAWAAERLHGDLKAPVGRLGAPFTPAPFPPHLEQDYLPGEEAVKAEVHGLMES